MEKKELTTEEWKTEKKKKKAQMTAMQALPYEVKVRRAELRAREYIGWAGQHCAPDVPPEDWD